MYLSAVLSTRDAAAVGLGERGMRGVEPLPARPAELLALITRPASTTPPRMVPGETAIVPCAHAERTSMAEGTTAMGRTRMHDIDLLGATKTTTANGGGVGDLSSCEAASAPEARASVRSEEHTS